MNDQPLDPELDPAARLERLPERVEELLHCLETVIVGERETFLAILYALLSRGHALLVGVPGLARRCWSTRWREPGFAFSRIQFTPDLMPSDITGPRSSRRTATRAPPLRFVPGPVFTNLLLADEINRTPPKTQAALLEAMQERQSPSTARPARSPPFLVLATQNPIEQEGTYPLPEAQLDRFLFQPRRLSERGGRAADRPPALFEPVESLEPLWRPDEVLALRDAVARIPAAAVGGRLRGADMSGDPAREHWLRTSSAAVAGARARARARTCHRCAARAACTGASTWRAKTCGGRPRRPPPSHRPKLRGGGRRAGARRDRRGAPRGRRVKMLDPKVLATLSGLELRARTVMEGLLSGIHESPFHGLSVEFSTTGTTSPGDALSHVDWRLYAAASGCTSSASRRRRAPARTCCATRALR